MPRERDPLWQHVDRLSGDRWKCKYCEKVAAGGLTRIKAHFAKVRKLGITVCEKASHRVRSEAQRAMDGEKAVESSNRQGNVGWSSNLTQGPHQLVSASNEDARRETSYTATLYRSSDDIRTAGASSSAYVSVPGTNFPNQSLPANTWRPPNAVPQGEMPRAMDPSLDCVMYAGGIEEPFAGDGGHGHNVVNGQVRSDALQVSKRKRVAESSSRQGNVEGPPEITQGPYQLVSARIEDAQRETAFVAMPSRSSDVGSTTGATSSDFVSVPRTNFPSQFLPAQTMIRQRDNPFWPQPSQSHAGDFCTERCNLSHASSSRGLSPESLANIWRPPNAEVGDPNTEVPQGEMPRGTDPSLGCFEHAGGIKHLFAGDGGHGIHGCKVAIGQVRSEALQASKHTRVVESSNRQGNVEGSPIITQGPHQLVSGSYEDAQRETAFVATPSRSSDVGSTTGATSSAFVSVPRTNFPNQFLPAQTMIRQRDNPFWLQTPQSHAGDFCTEQCNLSHASSSRGLAPEALANMWRPPNAEVGDPNTEVPQGVMPRGTDPSLDYFEHARGIEDLFAGDGGYGIHGFKVANGQVRLDALQASKHTRVVESSNGQGNVEGPPVITQGPHQLVSGNYKEAQRETAFVATPSRSSDVRSTTGATSSAFVAVPRTNFPNQFLPAQTMIRQRDNPFWPQPSQSHAGDFCAERYNLSHASGSRGLSPESLVNMWRPPNAEVGDPNTEVPQDKCFEVRHSNLEKPWLPLTKLREDIASVQGYMKDIILNWTSKNEELWRVVCATEALPPEKVAEMEQLSKEVEVIHLFLKTAAKQQN